MGDVMMDVVQNIGIILLAVAIILLEHKKMNK